MTICQKYDCSLCCRDREVVLTRKDITKLLTYGHYEQVFARPSKYGHNIKELIFVDGECVFLKHNKCTVYANRPTACRIFPYCLDENGGCIDDECTHSKEFKNDESFMSYAQCQMDDIIDDIRKSMSFEGKCTE